MVSGMLEVEPITLPIFCMASSSRWKESSSESSESKSASSGKSGLHFCSGFFPLSEGEVPTTGIGMGEGSLIEMPPLFLTGTGDLREGVCAGVEEVTVLCTGGAEENFLV